jgi:hypothetical protein
MLGREVLKTVISLFPVIQQVLTAVIVLSMFKKGIQWKVQAYEAARSCPQPKNSIYLHCI